MAIKKLPWLVAASAWLPTAHSSIAGRDAATWTSPAQTFAAYREADVRPAPPAPTSPPSARNFLKKRASVNTCGYVDADPDQGYACVASNAVCLYNSVASAVGCCLETNCNIYTACLPYASSRATATANMDVTRYCSNAAAPYCAIYLYADPTWAGYTIPTCYSTPATFLIYASTFAGTNGPTNTGPPTIITTPTDPPKPAPTPIEDKKSVPLGPIIGGVVGGVVFLSLVGLGIFFLLRRKPKTQIQPPAPAPAPGGGPGFPPQPSYANQAAVAAPPPNGMSTVPNPQALGPYPPVDNRPSSMFKPGFDTTVQPIPTPSPASPPPMYNMPQQHAAQPVSPQFTGQTMSPQYTGQTPVSPQFTGQTVSPQYTGQTVSPQFTGQPAPFPQQGYPPQPQQAQQAQQPQHFVAELSTQKGDGQVHEMATTS